MVGMYMSGEVITIIIAAASLFLALGGGLFAGFAWTLRRMDEGFHQAEARNNLRFDQVDKEFDKVGRQFEKVDQQFDKVYLEFDKVRAELGEIRVDLHELRTDLTEVKISVARLEGPQPRLILPG